MIMTLVLNTVSAQSQGERGNRNHGPNNHQNNYERHLNTDNHRDRYSYFHSSERHYNHMNLNRSKHGNRHDINRRHAQPTCRNMRSAPLPPPRKCRQ